MENISQNTDQPLAIGSNIPDFTAKATSHKDIQLSACTGYNVILYFYPKDNTPGCTLESQGFAEHYSAFKALNTCIFGVSRDSLSSHEKFKQQFNLPFELISDETEALCNLFKVIKPKMLYGRQVIGIERSTFLIDKTGCLIREWRKVKVEHHAQAVLDAIQQSL